MAEQKHTAGAVKLSSSSSQYIVRETGGVIARAEDGYCCDRTTAELNAERIVLCWNTHDDLVAALKGMLSEWEKFSRYGSPLAKSANERVNAARAALARGTPNSVPTAGPDRVGGEG